MKTRFQRPSGSTQEVIHNPSLTSEQGLSLIRSLTSLPPAFWFFLSLASFEVSLYWDSSCTRNRQGENITSPSLLIAAC